MLTDLTHNKIVSDTITDKFIGSVSSVLVPLVEGIFGESAIAIQMYEDYLSDGFNLSGRWCYPFTVLTDDGARTLWVSWSVDKRKYKGGIPYSYIGEAPIDFTVMDNVPDEFIEKLIGRNTYAPDGYIKLGLHSASDDALFLAGKYSQTFIDEMAKQLTERISEAMSVGGLDSSVLSLQMVFAPETYMEHTSENVTYRRLRLMDKTSAPRDFWIKWKRNNSAVAYSVSDAPAVGTIEFELGEDVSQKIREKEYRFLLRSSAEKYHSAMGRKNITEWRELVKRAIKRGELVKTDIDAKISADTEEVDERLSALLASITPTEPAAAPETDIESAADVSLEEALMRILEEPLANEEPEEIIAEEDENVFAEDVEEISKADEIELTSEEPSLSETEETPALTFVEEEEADDKTEAESEFALPEISEITESIEVVKDALKIEENKEIENEEPTLSATDEQLIRAEIEAKIRLEYESVARLKAEEEARKLFEEQERLRRENERLMEEARLAKEKREREEAEQREREERLKAEIEAKVRAEAREKERLAEAAMIAIEEKRRLEAEKAEQMRRAQEEARLKEAQRRAEEERIRLEELRRAEAERIRREADERIAAERAKMQAEMASAQLVEKDRKPTYTFVSKKVKFFFRYHVDPNITEPMEAIIRSTLEKAGKTDVPINIKASVVDEMTVCLDFVKIPKEEEDLFIQIVQALGNGNLGIAKARVEQ